MNRLEGANCADLPGFVIDKYFDCDVGRERFRAQVGMAICSNCVVMEACLSTALTMPQLPPRGVLGGVAVSEIRRARAWQSYETGQRPTPPPVIRPRWLPYSDAASAQLAEPTTKDVVE